MQSDALSFQVACRRVRLYRAPGSEQLLSCLFIIRLFPCMLVDQML